MTDNRPRAAVGSFPYPHRTVAEIDAERRRAPSHSYIRPLDASKAERAPERVVCPRCQAINCTRHSLSVNGWQRFARSA